jgi:4-hydroxythreonine-4-phosphate dehydrogenase
VAGPELPATSPHWIPCIEASPVDLVNVRPGTIDARAGQAAYTFLNTAIDLALAGRVDAITTLPLQKEALRLAGVSQPGHTEILAERCGVADHAMMLFVGPPISKSATGLAVLHATLHVALREVFSLLTQDRVAATIALADNALRPLIGGRPRIGVAGLNPHAGEHGLFGGEEATLIEPAIVRARASGIDAAGPFPADTLFRRGLAGDFDAVVAMYHDQGHAAIKSVAFHEAVNVTLGLPIVRTSVAHGTAFDIAWTGQADPASLRTAITLATRIATGRRALARGQEPAQTTARINA